MLSASFNWQHLFIFTTSFVGFPCLANEKAANEITDKQTLESSTINQNKYGGLFNTSIKMLVNALADPGGAASAPPTGSNSFVFAYVFAKKCPHRRLAPPKWLGAPPPQREILDPLLEWLTKFPLYNKPFIMTFLSDKLLSGLQLVWGVCHLQGLWLFG